MKKNFDETTNHPDLSLVEGSMTKVMQDHQSEIDSCTSVSELSTKVKAMFVENNIDTNASRRLLINISKQRNFANALQLVYNSILSGSKLGVIK